jgi:FG-GAP-like repeat
MKRHLYIFLILLIVLIAPSCSEQMTSPVLNLTKEENGRYGEAQTIVPGFLLSSFGPKWRSHTIDPNLPRAAIVQAGDIDGDNDMDIVATSFSAGKVVWYDNNPSTQKWDLSYTINDILPGASGVQIADIDNDGDLDVVAAGNEVHDVVWYKNEGGTPIQWTKFVIDDAVLANVVYVTDIDSDGDPDVLVAAWDGYGILLYENNNLTWTGPYAIGYLDGAVCLESYDMDGDYDLDIVATSLLESKVYWFENDPPNHSWYRRAIDKQLPEAFGLGVADMDNDGDPDVAATSLTRDDVIWYENNDLSWTKHIVDANLDGARYLSVLDIDADRDPDLVVTGYDADVVVWYRNDLPQDTVWTRNTIDGNLNGANYVSAADMNGDAHTDIIVTAWFENRVVWYENPLVGIASTTDFR